ncbi:hypothetical protein AMEX_G8090 [Astyanax mexicanus]|uniref:Ig-like domain-containing protein n=1 Tax=Astyanax mexicanus TaxID=7994 RepID=A0A8T2LY47_ASTMX|nr:hypothetical protein AMEX_G8090 [Astyanax mexicanus]
MQFSCIIFDETGAHKDVFMYLCRNGVGVMMEPQGKNREYTFNMRRVSVEDSGNYSCVYSINLHNLEDVKSSGGRTIHVRITDFASAVNTPAPPTTSINSNADNSPPNFQPASIYGNTTGNTGDHMQFRCIIFDETGAHKDVFMYLCRNGVGVMMEPQGKNREYTFNMRRVSVEDSGNYSCVYSINLHNLEDVKSSGGRTIHVRITDSSHSPLSLKLIETLLFSLGVLLVAGMLFLGIYCTYTHNSKLDHPQLKLDCCILCFMFIKSNRKETFNDMYAYATISEVDGRFFIYNAGTAVYSLAEGPAIYSTAQKPEKKRGEQPAAATEAMYAKVQKQKQEKTYDQIFMYE